MGWIEPLSWAVTVIAIAGVVLNNARRRECFVLWWVSNLATAAIHIADGSPIGLVARDVIFLALAVHGFIAWGRPQKGARR